MTDGWVAWADGESWAEGDLSQERRGTGHGGGVLALGRR